MLKPHQRSSSQPVSESELQPWTESEATHVSIGPHILLPISPDDSDPPEEEILAQNDWYIIFLAWQIVNGNTKFVHPAVLDLMVDDLIQNSRIKLWLALRKGVSIHSLKGLIRQIVHNEFINLVRQHKPSLSLPLDDDGELRQGKPITGKSTDLDNPERVVEQEMMVDELLHTAAVGVATMRPCQKQAMICSLKETVEDVPQLKAIFEEHGVEIDAVVWPEEKSEVVRLKTSLSPARRRMRSMRSESVCA